MQRSIRCIAHSHAAHQSKRPPASPRARHHVSSRAATVVALQCIVGEISVPQAGAKQIFKSLVSGREYLETPPTRV